MLSTATSGNMSGYPPAPSYGGADPRWPANQQAGYDPNMPYPPYNMNPPYVPPRDPHTMYGAHAGAPYMNPGAHPFTPNNIPNNPPPPATYHQPIEEAEQLSDAMDVDAREEGELSSCGGDVERRSFNSDNRSSHRHERHEPHAQSSSGLRQGDASTDLEANGAQSTGTGILTGSQEKPDIPEKGPSAKDDVHTSSLAGKSPSQLKVLAQGALLNLAPHKIRYNELVQEGIDAAVLKSLYDEIGIKIMAEPDNKAVLAHTTSNEASPVAQKTSQAVGLNTPNGASSGQGKPTAPAREEQAATAKQNNEVTSANSNKPMERKDVIARMLAAKAAKAPAPAGTPSQSASSQPTKMAIRPLNESTTQPAQSTPLSTAQSTAQNTRDEVRTKEKNKAQTELARQRMEQLKKVGLGKTNTQIPGLVSTPPAIANMDSSVPTASQEPSSLPHPLPDRPPLPGNAASTRIPGLIMTNSESSKVDEPTTNDQTQNEKKEVTEPSSRMPRKRPRASDFTDDLDDTPARKYSGVGHRSTSAEQRVIIDISDDEAMYGLDDDEAGGMTDATNLSRVTSSSTKPTIRELPPLPDFPPRNYGSHRSTPVTVSSTPPKPTNGLLQKNMEILAMRQRIAELEARRGKKQTTAQNRNAESSNESGATQSDDAQQEAENSSSELENARKTLKQTVERALSEANEPTTSASTVSIPVTSSLINPPSLSPAPSSQAISHPNSRRAEELRLKALRRKEIESGLPLLDAELLKTEQKLAEFREQERKLLEQIAKGREGKRRLIEELESLGIETEGLSMAELKEISNDIESTEDGSVNEQEPATKTTIDQNQQHEITPPNDDKGNAPDTNVPDASEEASSPDPHSAQAEGDVHDASNSQDEIMQGTSSAETHELREGSYSSSAMDESMGSSEDESEDEPASVAKSLSLASTGNEAATTTRDPSPHHVEVNASQNDACVTGTTSILPNQDDDEYCPTPREASVLSDGYEPPEPDVSMDDGSLDSPPFSPAPPDPIEQISIAPPETRDTPMLTPSNQEAATTTAPESPMNDANAPSHQLTHRFDPYHSPLNIFRAYRYHPNFTDHVEGGFRSLTYSHKIDPHKPLCDLEITGGVCDAPSCGFQHFRDMNLSDDKILVEMGSLREGKTPAEREEYVTGLRQIINDMRRDKVKDFAIVAQEIAAYRRRFLQDPSRVLAL
ncbi:uncharacterized protein GIQ15_05463 [Arthroderma uncinatum]|uniref:uncharacterized protein n=1 Tax=Arthroderma uncinatum TaxID=74035 RepID=UPI00144A6EB3|nr:uncharacterized protein GIQ15_05463 [Arthroderma uncinatum]KAF3480116.1 hypothetical protein GIQ15_05463 [Arthroderma uncinatum]